MEIVPVIPGTTGSQSTRSNAASPNWSIPCARTASGLPRWKSGTTPPERTAPPARSARRKLVGRRRLRPARAGQRPDFLRREGARRTDRARAAALRLAQGLSQIVGRARQHTGEVRIAKVWECGSGAHSSIPYSALFGHSQSRGAIWDIAVFIAKCRSFGKNGWDIGIYLGYFRLTLIARAQSAIVTLRPHKIVNADQHSPIGTSQR